MQATAVTAIKHPLAVPAGGFGPTGTGGTGDKGDTGPTGEHQPAPLPVFVVLSAGSRLIAHEPQSLTA